MKPSEWKDVADLPLLRRRLLAWYRQHARDLPWRQTRDPYHIWISEIMLQQTTVATVLGYFDRFLERFPTIADLAAAPEEAVLHLWQGLGYYRRARNLHKAAQVIVRDHGGVFPTDPEVIRSLPGLGRYTANAIACFALDQRLPIIEANTRRLWARVCAASGDPAKPPLEAALWDLARDVLPNRGFADFNQAAMDLGSMICTPRQPACGQCPLQHACMAYQQGEVERYPELAAKRAFVETNHVTVVLWDQKGKKVLVTQRPDTGQWAGLWEFPRVEQSAGEEADAAARRAVATFLSQPFRLRESLLTLRHGIMHYRVTLRCFEAEVTTSVPSKVLADSPVRWVIPVDLPTLPFSSPQRRIVAHILKHPRAESRSRPKSGRTRTRGLT